MSKPEFVDVGQHDLNSLLTRVSNSSLESSDKKLLLNIVQCYVWLQVTLREAKMSIARLRRVLGFGKTEKRKMTTLRNHQNKRKALSLIMVMRMIKHLLPDQNCNRTKLLIQLLNLRQKVKDVWALIPILAQRSLNGNMSY